MSTTERDKMQARWEALKSERAYFHAECRDVSANLLPHMGKYFLANRNRPEERRNKIIDDTARKAHKILAAGLMSGATSPARPWFRLAVGDQDLMTNYNVKVWLADVRRIMMAIFNKSNTYNALQTEYAELAGFGTAATIVEPDFQNVLHNFNLTAGEFAIATDFKGRTNTLYREFQKSVGQLVLEFGYDNCSSAVQRLYDTSNYEQYFTIMHAIEPREMREYGKKDAKNKRYKSCYWELGSEKGKLLRESGYNDFPALCPRWDVIGGDTYGTSPAIEALGNIRQLQQQQYRKAQAIDFQSDPPVQVPTFLKDRDIDRFPGGVTFVDATGSGNAIQSMFDVQLNLQHLTADIRDVQQRIRESFYTDLFLMLAQHFAGRMTATEVAERKEEKLLMLGPVMERLHGEELQPRIAMTFDMMIEANIVPPPPEELAGQELSVEFVSVLAQAQRAVATNSVDRYVLSIGTIAQMKPEVLDKFDADVWADSYADMLGVDPELIVANDKVAIIRNQRAQQQQALQASAMAQSGADTAQKLSNTDTSGDNALANIMQQYSQF
jgi:hypothetical protein